MEPFSQFEMLAIKSYRQHISDMVRKLKSGTSSDLDQISACSMPSGDMIYKIRKSVAFFSVACSDGVKIMNEAELKQLLDTMVPSYIVKKHFPELLL